MEWVATIVAGILSAITLIAVAILGRRGKREELRDQRAPDVTEAWAAADRARILMHFWQDLFYLVRGAFRGYARRMHERDPANALTDEERAALDVSTTPPDPT